MDAKQQKRLSNLFGLVSRPKPNVGATPHDVVVSKHRFAGNSGKNYLVPA